MKAFFLFLDTYTVNIFNGIKTRHSKKGPYIQLPLIDGVPAGKFSVMLDRKNPATMDKNEKIHEIYFQIYGGRRFRDAGFVTACAPTKDTGAIAVFTSKRWPEIGLKILNGQPNGEFPGVQILNEGDTVGFTHAGISYQLTNSGGEPWLTRERKNNPKPAVKQAKKESKIEVVGNHKKNVEQPKVVAHTSRKKSAPKNSQVAKFEKKYGLKQRAVYLLGEVLKGAGVKLPQG